MPVHLVSPSAVLIALVGLAPLALVLLVERRNVQSRAVLGLPAPGRASRLVLPTAVAALTAALALAAAQPVYRTEHARKARLDAEAVIAIDTSRSMEASATARSPVRLDRARAIAERIRDSIPEVPTGIGTFTDRPLPLVMPTPDRQAFSSALRDSLGIERPPGLQSSTTISSFDAVAPFPLEGYFAPRAKKRLLVILTDAESTGFNEAGVRKSFEAKPRTAVVLVRIGRPGERVFGPSGQPESAYVPPPATGETLREFLGATNGHAFDEHDVGQAEQAASAALGSGPTVRLGTVTGRHDLAPWFVLAGIVPLGVVLRRRNF